MGPVRIYLRQGGEGEAATAAVLSCAGDYCSAPLHHAAALSAVLAVGVKMLQPSSKPCKLCTILQQLRDTRFVDGTLSVLVGFIRFIEPTAIFSFSGYSTHSASPGDLN